MNKIESGMRRTQYGLTKAGKKEKSAKGIKHDNPELSKKEWEQLHMVGGRILSETSYALPKYRYGNPEHFIKFESEK